MMRYNFTFSTVFLAALLTLSISCSDLPDTRGFYILAINDVYRLNGVADGQQGGLHRVRTLRKELQASGLDVLMLHGGDLLFPSLLSETYQGKQMVDVLNHLDGAPNTFDSHFFTVLGNHEFDKGTEVLADRIREAEFTWLSANLQFKRADSEAVFTHPTLRRAQMLELGGVQVGIFGLSIHIDKAHTQVNRDYVGQAVEMTAELRAAGAEVVIALTHLNEADDRDIVAHPDGPDLIVGGHEHDQIIAPIKVADAAPSEPQRWLTKADADARSATVIKVAMRAKGQPYIARPQNKPLTAEVKPDPQLADVIDKWRDEHEKKLCTERFGEGSKCLSFPIGYAAADLNGDELDIRMRSTNLGNWATDQMLAAAHTVIEPDNEGPLLAIMNSGGLRLNQSIPAGQPITRRHIEELLAYPTHLVLLEVSGAVITEVAERAVSDWQGNGHFLQVAGFGYRHDGDGNLACLFLLDKNGQAAPLVPEQTYQLVVNRFLTDPDMGNRDGYTMLDVSQADPEFSVAPLKTLLYNALARKNGPLKTDATARVAHVDAARCPKQI